MNCGETYIYFLECFDGETRYLKIGRTTDIKKRLDDLRRGGAANLKTTQIECLAYLIGNRTNENQLHVHFGHLTLGKPECFAGSPDLLEYIRWLRNQYFVSIDVDNPPADAASYDFWRPDDFRRVSHKCEDQTLFDDIWFFDEPNITPDDYHTPKSIMQFVHDFFGHPDLDPASHPMANRVVKAETIYTIEQDGLSHRWFGNVWLNAPFSRYVDFATKVDSELNAGEVSELVMLQMTNSLTAHYMYPLLQRCTAFVVIRGRHAHTGLGLGKSPTEGHVLIYFGPHKSRWLKIMADLGTCFSNPLFRPVKQTRRRKTNDQLKANGRNAESKRTKSLVASYKAGDITQDQLIARLEGNGYEQL